MAIVPFDVLRDTLKLRGLINCKLKKVSTGVVYEVHTVQFTTMFHRIQECSMSFVLHLGEVTEIGCGEQKQIEDPEELLKDWRHLNGKLLGREE